jgi:hypothetical protein
LISLPSDEQAEMMKTFAVGVSEVTKPKPALNDAYDIVTAAAQRAQ